MKPQETTKKLNTKKATLKVENESTPKNPYLPMLCNPSWTDV
jgi:hypothetical protein